MAAVRTIKPPCSVFALTLNDALQPLALFFGSNLARHAGVITVGM